MLCCTGPCGFENPSLCGFDQDISENTHWLHLNGSTGHVDHTYRTQMGESFAKEWLELELSYLLLKDYF